MFTVSALFILSCPYCELLSQALRALQSTAQPALRQATPEFPAFEGGVGSSFSVRWESYGWGQGLGSREGPRAAGLESRPRRAVTSGHPTPRPRGHLSQPEARPSGKDWAAPVLLPAPSVPTSWPAF